MESIEQPCYTLISNPSDIEPPTEIQLKCDLERGTIPAKIEALKKIIRYISNGDRLPGLLVPIIRFVLPSQDHMIKKLLLIFWEIVPKTTTDGNLLQEIILVCDAYRKDLEHPNEFVRGSTLRFLCKLKEPELLEPLLPAIRSCLNHKSSYVRRNAVLAIFTIYRNFEFLIPDASELIACFLENEKDMSCKRNAFLMLLHTDLQRAVSYLVSCLDKVSSFGDILQLMVVQLMHKVCLENPLERSRFIRCIYNLLNSNSAAVRYEAAGTLLTLSNAPTAIRAVATCYIDLIVKESDNNVKLIVLDRLISLKECPTREKVLQDLVMDVLRVLASPDLEVKEKALNLVLELTTFQTVHDVISVVKKEVHKAQNCLDLEESEKYIQVLVKVLHACCLKYPDIASNIIPPLIDCISDNLELVSNDVVVLLREAAHKFESLRALILEKLLIIFPSIKFIQVSRAALWILGEYAFSSTLIQNILDQIKTAVGRSTLTGDKLNDLKHVQEKNQTILSGAYAAQFSVSRIACTEFQESSLRQHLMDGHFMVGVSVARVLVKLAFRYVLLERNKRDCQKFILESMLIISTILAFSKSSLACIPAQDDLTQILLCLKVLSKPNKVIFNIFTVKCRQAISNMLTVLESEECFVENSRKQIPHSVDVDSTVTFSQLTSLTIFDIELENSPELSLHQAVMGQLSASKTTENDLLPVKLSKVSQLTGFSDPVYAEAYVHSNQYDIVLDVLIVNQTDDLLQNCTLELATLGDLKLVEKPQSCVLAPHDFCNIKAVIKVASTENGVIFGNIVYDISGSTSDKNIVVLNDIRIDIMDYIAPSKCSDADFRRMWAVFEWENKISVNTGISDLRKYLDHLLKFTRMKCLQPEKVLFGQCEFLSANLYARSIFSEDALVNLSIEKSLNSQKALITGHIRIRAKSQGMALYLGEIINKAQKESPAIEK